MGIYCVPGAVLNASSCNLTVLSSPQIHHRTWQLLSLLLPYTSSPKLSSVLLSSFPFSPHPIFTSISLTPGSALLTKSWLDASRIKFSKPSSMYQVNRITTPSVSCPSIDLSHGSSLFVGLSLFIIWTIWQCSFFFFSPLKKHGMESFWCQSSQENCILTKTLFQECKKSAWPKPIFLNFLLLFKELGLELVSEEKNNAILSIS